MTRPGQIAAALLQAEQLDKDWRGRIPQDREEHRLYTAWMPFPLAAFQELLDEALTHLGRMTDGPVADLDPRYLEIGCGPGSKLLVARDICGLNAHGIEKYDEMAAAARFLGLDAETADALGWRGYGNYDLIWFNRPFRDPAAEAKLEAEVWEAMAPGATVICANLNAPPPQDRFFPVLENFEAGPEIWMKLPSA